MRDVRFIPESGYSQRQLRCPLSAKTRHCCSVVYRFRAIPLSPLQNLEIARSDRSAWCQFRRAGQLTQDRVDLLFRKLALTHDSRLLFGGRTLA
jgi:hypothetical protein